MLFYIISAILVFVLYAKWQLNYWTRRGVYQSKPKFLFGNAKDQVLGKKSIFNLFLDKYKEIKALKLKHGGIYFLLKPIYIPVDLSIIKRILIKDFWYFAGHGGFSHPNDPLSMNLFDLEGELWKQLRTKLTPTFTSGKMKMMFETLVEKTHGLEEVVNVFINNNEVLDIKEIGARFTTDIIASCAFGIESNALKDSETELRKYGRKALTPSLLRIILLNYFPSWLLGPLGFKNTPADVSNYFSSTVKDTIRYREQNNIFRKDFMHLLLQIKNNQIEEDKTRLLTENEIIAQCLTFFLAGFETSSTTMTFALFELSQNQDYQDKLRNEILDVLEQHDGQITYEAIMEMKYLEMVIKETLRKYPPLAALPRVCTKKYSVPDTDVIIEKGTKVQIPIWAIHKDPEYYPNPEEFNPENFSPENIAKRPDMTFLPFGEGPRICIGLRFGMMQTKTGLVSLLRHFRFTVNKKTKAPLVMDSYSFLLSAEGDIWLDAQKI